MGSEELAEVTVGVMALATGALREAALALWDRLERDYRTRGVRTFAHPNLTFQGAHVLGIEWARAACALAARRVAPFAFAVDGLGWFERLSPVLYLRVRPDEALLRAHRAIHDALAEAGVEGMSLYRPGSWVPHVTLAMGDLTAEALARAKRDLADLPLTFVQPVAELTLARLDPLTGLIEVDGRYRVQG